MMRDGPILAQSHPPAGPRPTNYRVVLKLDEGEFEIGSIGIPNAWGWDIDTVIRMRTRETQGKGKCRRDCMRQFRTTWKRFAADETNLTEFLNAKRKRR